MKKHIKYGVCILSAAMMFAQPISVHATEITDTQMAQSEQLLTAGVGDLFSSTLTAEEYKEIAKQAEGALWGYTHLGICNVQDNNLNIRQEADESGKLVGKLPKNAACEVVSSENGWAYIKSGKVEGYVKEECDEVGMYGSNASPKPDQNVRIPIKWGDFTHPDCRVISGTTEQIYPFATVTEQMKDQNSILN